MVNAPFCEALTAQIVALAANAHDFMAANGFEMRGGCSLTKA